MNIWALAALVFLLAAMYVPGGNHLVHLIPLSFTRFLTIAVVVIVTVLLLELKNCLFSQVISPDNTTGWHFFNTFVS